MPAPTFTEFEQFLRDQLGLRQRKLITLTTCFENDLGVTGDDGVDLLEATEKQFGISLEPLRETFSMQPNEYLFESEGIDWANLFLPKHKRSVVRNLTVGELYEAVCRKLSEQNWGQ
jgi:hypothetical protein